MAYGPFFSEMFDDDGERSTNHDQKKGETRKAGERGYIK